MAYLTDSIREILLAPKNIVVTMHRDPDADAIGSSLGWAAFLKKIGHKVTVISPTEVPGNLTWLDTGGDVLNFEDRKAGRQQCIEAIDAANLICCLDFSAIGRLKDMAPFVSRSKTPVLMIDHHLDPEPFATFLVSDVSAAATAQIVYHCIRELDKSLMDQVIAERLYAGIMTDTGSFRHNNTTSDVHLAVADLIGYGVEVDKVHRMIFDNSPLSRLQMLGHSLSTITVLPEFRVSYMVLTHKTLEAFRSSVGDTDGIVNFGLQVEDVVMTALFIERNNEVKISFRSVADFSVRELAHAHFEGGGHKNASGGRSNLSLSATIEKFLGILPDYRDQLRAVSK